MCRKNDRRWWINAYTKAEGESENMEYTHMKCDCGGIIGMRDKENFSCDKCGKVYRIGSEYDVLMTNEKTGWIFPMIKKE